MATTFELIATASVGSGGAANMTFSVIPSTFTDLAIKISCATNTQNDLVMQFNGNGSGYTWRLLEGAGSGTPGSYNGTTGRIGLVTQSTTTFSSADVYIPNYAGSANKSYTADAVSENNGTTAYADLTAGLWSNTSAITSIVLSCAGNFNQYSTAYLYGVKNA
jgi:hypothetical protein